jgi:hypothetical protein
VKQSKIPEYGRVPSGYFFIFINFVLMLSGGRDIKAQTKPAQVEEINLQA